MRQLEDDANITSSGERGGEDNNGLAEMLHRLQENQDRVRERREERDRVSAERADRRKAPTAATRASGATA